VAIETLESFDPLFRAQKRPALAELAGRCPLIVHRARRLPSRRPRPIRFDPVRLRATLSTRCDSTRAAVLIRVICSVLPGRRLRVLRAAKRPMHGCGAALAEVAHSLTGGERRMRTSGRRGDGPSRAARLYAPRRLR